MLCAAAVLAERHGQMLLTLDMSAWGAKPRLLCLPWRVLSCVSARPVGGYALRSLQGVLQQQPHFLQLLQEACSVCGCVLLCWLVKLVSAALLCSLLHVCWLCAVPCALFVAVWCHVS
jgi:hypothetical protein